jgi:hypothetical protein
MVEMTKESITLKNVKVAHHMSEGTIAFTATLHINGKKAAYVKNDGRGGDNHPSFTDRELGKEFHEFCNSLPPRQFRGTTSVNDNGLTKCCEASTTYHDTEECCKVCWKEIQDPFPMNYDSYIGDLLTEWMEKDDWKKACKKGIVYTLTSHEDGEYMLWKVPYSPEMAEQVRKQYSEVGNLKEIINERFL